MDGWIKTNPIIHHDMLFLSSLKVLLLDEATSSVDFETDQLVQRLIRQEFADCTIFTIAHRINTIIDSDMILVLRDGLLAEFDHPGALLSRENSLFSGMVNETGEASAAQLRRVALENWKKKQMREMGER